MLLKPQQNTNSFIRFFHFITSKRNFMPKPLIIFKDFSFQYYSQQTPTINQINLTIYEGQKVLIVGKNGSGKSTFLKCINGLIPHSYQGKITGTAIIKDKVLTQTNIFDLSLDVGTIMQDTDKQFVGLTVAEDIAFALENDALPQSKIYQKVNMWAQDLGLQSFLDYKPQELSEGHKQLASMAGVLIYNPSILLFDESLSNLDPVSRAKMTALIKTIHQKYHSTILVIEHYLEDILDDSFDRIIVFEDGKIIYDNSPQKLILENVLIKQSIQEPTYISALKKVGVNLEHLPHLLNLPYLKFSDFSQYFFHQLKNLKKCSISQNSPTQLLPSFYKHFAPFSPILQLQNISYHYEPRQPNILNNISLDLFPGEMISIFGKNGSGKSTLAKVICGFCTPQTGTILLNNQNISCLSLQQKSEKIGFVMQNPHHMISQKTVFKEVALGFLSKQLSLTEIKTKVHAILKTCNLEYFVNWPISALSFGQKKRLTIASILVMQPQILILDEPTIGQDLKHRTQIMTFLQKLNNKGITIVIITHDMSLMLNYTQRTLVLEQGGIIANTNTLKIFTDISLMQKTSLNPISLIVLFNKLPFTSEEKNVLLTQMLAFLREDYCYGK
ncbi:ABC-type cobalt transport system, ATP-binding protein [Aster yellows witches'-broom phytoplasma AYWB]|uniref:ABC-type cobalt transport system, ATP-binding protein n=2 Tax=16SrI (Aster yellows group) TaxID=3042590 RepID=Q2NKB2_AYWBP|nr:ABC-type cobalt transport system, ATP-binding protein [Aster yellows witches'-broom phytoplasma AYWB]